MPGNLILLKSYECHMISDKVLFLRHNTLIGKASRLLLMMIIVFVSKVHAQNPVASFSVPSSQGCVPFNVQFNNTSINAVSYQWSFGNGNTSTLANPSNVFTIAGTYTVTLTAFSSNGSSNSYSSQIIVQPKPAANFSVDINSGCQNSQIFTFTNLSTNFDSCNWDFGDGTTSNQWNPTHIYNLSGTFNVTLVVYNKVLGCSDLLVKGSFITILPAPSAMISVNDTSTCDNNFNFQFTALMNNAVSWNWDFDDGSFSSAMNPMHVFTDTGYFNVSLILTSSNGCVDKVYAPTPVHIKWNPLPVANISQDTGCMPLNLSLNTTYYSNTLYSWNLGNGITKTGSTVYYNYPDSGIFPVTLTATYSNGCQRQVNAGPVVVHPRPVFVFWMTNHTGCAPLNVQCVNQPAGNYTWLWDFGDGTTSTQQVPSHVYTAQGVYSVNLTGTSVNGCTYSYTQSLKINVFSPNAAFSTDVSSGCPPLSVNFSNNSTMASGYQWDFGDGTTSTQIHPTHVYTSPGTYTVKLIASDAGGCKDTLIVVNKITVSAATVNYQTPPDINGCAPYPVNFSDASGAASFLWDFGDGTTSTSANPYHVYTAPGIYVVSLTTWMPNGGCEQHISNFQTFRIDGAEPGFTYTISPCPPYEVIFTDTSLNAAGWQWSFGDGGSSTLQNPSHFYPGPGSYNVTLVVTTPLGCTTTLQANNSVVITGLGASASAICTDTVLPLDVQFYANATGATWWIWSFGDGDSAFVSDPLHTYTTAGPFTISLTIGNDSCVYTYTYPPIKFGSSQGTSGGLGGGVLPPPPRVYHCAPYTVSFSNPDITALAWLWDFGDGQTSNLSSPEHIYSDSGAFVPVLYLTNVFGVVDTFIFSDTFYVVKPVSDFNIVSTNLCAGVLVDVSTNTPGLNYLWNFGNGVTNTTATASYTYPNLNGSYMISLNITDTFNCESFVAKSFSVNATSPLSSNVRRGCANDSIAFNAGNINYDQYLWDFGDGNVSNLKNPLHAYSDSGIYVVSVQVTDINGCVQNFPLSYAVEIFNPKADFTYTTPLSNCETGTVVGLLSNLSTGSTSWLWQFGDNTTSSLFDPLVHNFYLPGFQGYYGITLIASKNICSDTMTIVNAVYGASLVADFNYTSGVNCVPAIVEFTDVSIDAVSWFWDFGDGDTSSLQHPVHVYNTNPADSITLTVRDMYGCVKTKSLPSPQLTAAAFSISGDGGCAPFNVTFSDSSSNAVSWSWQFGDGAVSNVQQPTNSYASDGYYDVTLIVTSASGCKDTLVVDSMIEVNTPVANFSVDTLEGCSPLFVNFTDQSLNAVAWNWNFGNGSYSANQNPSLIYTNPGYYDVQLISENKFGCLDSILIDSLVLVRGAVPLFTVSSVSGCAPHAISFANVSQNSVAYEWHFGDGTEDTSSNPVHVFTEPGTYTVSLYAFDSSGCSTIYTYPQIITVSLSPVLSYSVDNIVGCTPHTIQITDTSTVADSLVWWMGDGTVITGNNPTHTYTQPGNYSITLIAFNAEGCSDTLVYADTIIVNIQPIADFSADILEGCSPVEITFTNNSSGLSNPVYEWDFGNGDVSMLSDPSYTYTNQGVYTVSLIVTNDQGCSDTLVKTDYIDVYDQNPPPVSDIYRVTVNSPDEVFMEWQKTMVNDLDYYVVYRRNAMTMVYDSIGQVFQSNTGVNNNIPFFEDSGLNTNTSTYAYKVQAVDKCGLRVDFSALRAHETILLNAVGAHQQVALTWNPYGGCSVTGYEIYREDNGNGVFQLIAIVDSLVHNFVDTTAGCPVPYAYKVVGLNICGDPLYQSSSNSSTATPTSDVDDQFVDIVRSTVVDDEFVLTEWGEPSILPSLVDRFDVYRSTDAVNYQLIASVPGTAHEYSDFDVSVDQQDYYYKIIVQNICNVEAKEGFIGSSILLQRLEMGADYILKWTKYQQWNSGVETYVIEKLNGNGVWEEIERLPGTVTEWEEK